MKKKKWFFNNTTEDEEEGRQLELEARPTHDFHCITSFELQSNTIGPQSETIALQNKAIDLWLFRLLLSDCRFNLNIFMSGHKTR